jgi:hypothetical protein
MLIMPLIKLLGARALQGFSQESGDLAEEGFRSSIRESAGKLAFKSSSSSTSSTKKDET